MNFSKTLLRVSTLAAVLLWPVFAQQTPAPATPAALEPVEKASPAKVEAAAPAAELKPEAPPAPPVPPHAPAAPEGPPFGNHTVAKGETAPELVSLFGNSSVEGEVEREVVSIFGNTAVSGKVGKDAVSIFGNTVIKGDVDNDVVSVFGNTIIKGSAGHDAVAVFGNIYLDGTVNHDVVAVFGNVHLAPGATVNGKPVVVGGIIFRDSKAVAKEGVTLTPDQMLEHAGAAGTWIKQCLLKARLLGFTRGISFAWIIAAVYLAVYLFIALVFRRTVSICTEVISLRPGTILLSSLLALLAIPLIFLLLAITGVGLIVIPILALLLMIAKAFGRTALIAWLGRLATSHFGPGPFSHIAFSTLLGGLALLVIYCVPVLALVVYFLLGFLSVGVVIAAWLQNRKSKAVPPASPAAPASTAQTPGTLPLAFAAAPVSSETAPAPETASAQAAAPAETPVPPLPIAQATLLLPRADFWPRVGALALDVVVVSVLVSSLNRFLPYALEIPFHPGFGGLFIMALYGCLMWKWRGTTIGGLLLKLKVVRADGRPLDWSTCIIRGLGCMLSSFVVFLGFIWIAIDKDREGWHDKLSGTVVVKVPKHEPLV